MVENMAGQDAMICAGMSVIVIAGFLLRIWNLRKKGLFLWDEAAYYREAQFGIKTISFYKRNAAEVIKLKIKPDRNRRDDLINGCVWRKYLHYSYHKAWHFYINMFFVSLIGQKDYSIMIPALLMGTATIVVVYAFTTMLFGSLVGIIATVIIAFSGLHILHSRSSEPEVGVGLSVLLMLMFSISHKIAIGGYTKGFDESFGPVAITLLLGTGFFLSGIICFNIRWAPLFPPAYLVSELFFILINGKVVWSVFVISQAVVFVLFFVVLIITDLPFIAHRYLVPEIKVEPHTVKIFTDLRRQWRRLRYMMSSDDKSAQGMGVTLSKYFDITFYPDILRQTEGIAVLVMTLAGVVMVLAKGAPYQKYVAFFSVFVYVFLTFVPYKATRAAVNMLPLISAMAAYAISALPSYVGYAVIAFIGLRGIKYYTRILRLKSGMRKAAEYIKSKGEDRFLSTCVPFSMIYGRKDFFHGTVNNFQKLSAYYKMFGIKYLIMDHHVNYPTMMDPIFNQIIEERFDPVFIAEDPCVTLYPLLAECEYHTPRSLNVGRFVDVTRWNRFRQAPREIDKYIRVYKISDIWEDGRFAGIECDLSVREGDLLTEKNNYKDALYYYQRAKMLKNDDPMVRLKIGICHKQLGHPEWTAKIFRGLVRDDNLPEEYKEICMDYLYQYDGKENDSDKG